MYWKIKMLQHVECKINELRVSVDMVLRWQQNSKLGMDATYSFIEQCKQSSWRLQWFISISMPHEICVRYFMFNQSISLQWHYDEIFITGCPGSCQNDNFQCYQWWKFCQNSDIFTSELKVYMYVMGYDHTGCLLWGVLCCLLWVC